MSAIRFVAGKQGKGRLASDTIQLLCRVKANVNANREGIAAVTDQLIDTCVAAQARGQANTAIKAVIAKMLKVPKSDVDIAKGTKSREKTITVHVGADITPAEEIARVRALLSSSRA